MGYTKTSQAQRQRRAYAKNEERGTVENVRVVVSSIIKASLFAAPYDYGLTAEEIVEIALGVGLQRGQIMDELNENINSWYRVAITEGKGARYKLHHTQSYDLTLFRIASDGLRNIDAFQHIGDILHQAELRDGKRNAKVLKSEILAEGEARGIDRHDLDVALVCYLEFHELVADGEYVRRSAPGVRLNPKEYLNAAMQGQGVMPELIPNRECERFIPPVSAIVGRRAVPTKTSSGDQGSTVSLGTVSMAGNSGSGTPKKGDRFGSYELGDQIGSGAIGSVFRAWHVNLERIDAIKFLSGKSTGSEIRERFRREAISAARLDQENCVRMYDSSTYRGHQYIAMEYVDGHSLKPMMGSAWEIDLFYKVFTQLFKGLAHAHEKRVIHRDLKPANLLFSNGKLKIVDFGLAKQLDVDSDLTRTGAFHGTPKYASPEQFLQQAVGHEADLYAAGVIMYEAVVGRAPFESSSFDDMVRMHTRQEPSPLPSTVPAQLSRLILDLLKKQVSERPTSAAEVLDRLSRIST